MEQTNVVNTSFWPIQKFSELSSISVSIYGNISEKKNLSFKIFKWPFESTSAQDKIKNADDLKEIFLW